MPEIPIRRILKKDWPILLFRKRVALSVEKVLFVGSYSRVKVKLRGLTMDDVDFRLPAGAKSGVVSLCRDSDYNPLDPEVMLCVGYEPGDYVLQAVDKSTNILMAEEKFTVTTDWNDPKNGPSLSFTGISEELRQNPAWGGGPGTPQNLNVVPAIGTRRIAVIMLDTADARYSNNAATITTIKNRWMDEIINGVNIGGQVVSAKQYYQEVSYNNYDLSADIYGPVNLPNNWSTYFDTTANPNIGRPLAGFYQAAITASDSIINFNNYDNVIIISEQFTDGMGNVFNAWPYGGGGTFSTSEGSKNLGVVSMPREWGAAFRPDRNVRATVVHELGHSLGLGDQYTPDTGRNIGNWDPMHAEDLLPHFSLAHRMMLGWVPAGWLKPYNFANGGGVVNETISLSPLESGTPPAGKLAGIEIRLSDGWNYYVEYRSGHAPQIGDRSLDTNNAVLVTDVDSSPGDAPISRPLIIKVPNDSDNDGSVLVNGLDYRETDNTDPTFPTDFKLSVSGVNNTKADVLVQYGVNSRPDPAIRPWPASADRQWQSPDIEVQNVRNLADPANWFNVPWAGNPNTIIARVKNNGNLAAPNVRVEFYVKNFNVGGAPETFLGADTRNMPALGTVNFTASWNPPGNGHYCVIVKIPGYITPGPNPVLEMSIFNNLAQSNYTKFISATGSPATRETTYIEVGNPYERPTQIYIRPGQTNPLYRTYVENTSLLLDKGETRKVRVMFEYDETNLFKTPISLGKEKSIFFEQNKDRETPELRRILKKFKGVPNKVGLVAYIDNPGLDHPHTPTRLGGVDVEVITGRKTKFEYFYLDGRIGGRIIEDTQARSPVGVGQGTVLIIFRNDENPEKPKVEYEKVAVDWNGHFVSKVTEKAEEIGFRTIQGYFLPTDNYSDCYSEIIKRQ